MTPKQVCSHFVKGRWYTVTGYICDVSDTKNEKSIGLCDVSDKAWSDHDKVRITFDPGNMPPFIQSHDSVTVEAIATEITFSEPRLRFQKFVSYERDENYPLCKGEYQPRKQT